MSHIATIDVVISDLEALKETCKAKGWTFKEGQKTYKWFGSWVGDTPMPKGMKKSDLGKCDHAIGIPGCKYEVGVRVQDDGSYGLAWDYWGAGGLVEALGGQKAPKLVQGYATEKLKIEARRMSYAVESEEIMADGSVRMSLLAGY